MGQVKKWWWMIAAIIFSSAVGMGIAHFYNHSTSGSKITFNQINEIRQINEQQLDGDYMAEIPNDTLEKIIFINPTDCLIDPFSNDELVTVGNYGGNSELICVKTYAFEEKNNTNKPYIETTMVNPSWSKRSVNTSEIIYKNKKISTAYINNNKIVFGEYNNTSTKTVCYTAVMQINNIDYTFLSHQNLEKQLFVEYVVNWSTHLNN